MPRRKRSSATLIAKAAELAVAVPQVVAHRVTRMALAGPVVLSARDRREFHRMGAEKVAALSEAWGAMAAQTLHAQRTFAASWVSAAFAPGRAVKAPLHAAAQWQHAVLGVLEEGIAPVHRRATANARRLARTKLR